jgi:hypothetical protein
VRRAARHGAPHGARGARAAGEARAGGAGATCGQPGQPAPAEARAWTGLLAPGLGPDAWQRQETLHRARHAPAVLLLEDRAGRLDVADLVVVEAHRADQLVQRLVVGLQDVVDAQPVSSQLDHRRRVDRVLGLRREHQRDERLVLDVGRRVAALSKRLAAHGVDHRCAVRSQLNYQVVGGPPACRRPQRRRSAAHRCLRLSLGAGSRGRRLGGSSLRGSGLSSWSGLGDALHTLRRLLAGSGAERPSPAGRHH